MTKAYSNDLRARVVSAMQSGESCRSVAARFGVAPSSVVKWTDRARRTGSVSPAKMGGYRRPILDPHRGWLLKQVRHCPHVTLAVPQSLLEERGVTSAMTRFGDSYLAVGSVSKKTPPLGRFAWQIACRAMGSLTNANART